MEYKFKGVHPYSVLDNLSKYAFFVAVSVVQRLLFQPKSLVEFFETVGVNLVLVVFFLCEAVLRFKSVKYRLYRNSMTIKNGILLKHVKSIPFSKVTSVSCRHSMVTYMIGVQRISIETAAGSKSKADVKLRLPLREVAGIKSLIFKGQKKLSKYKPSFFKMMLMSVLWSNPASGLIILVAFVNGVGKILGQKFKDQFYQAGSNVQTTLVSLGLPPVTAMMTYFLVFGWTVALLSQVLNYSGFTVSSYSKTVNIKRGALIRRSDVIFKRSVNAISVKQTLLMRLFNLYSAYLFSPGSKKEKDDKSLIVAPVKYDKMVGLLNLIVGFPYHNYKNVTPEKKAYKSFLVVPGIVFIMVTFFSGILIVNRIYKELVLFVLLFSVALISWWTVLRYVSAHNSGVFSDGDVLIISGYKALSMESAVIPICKIQKIVVSQNLFQKISNRCNVRVFVKSEKNLCFTSKHLNMDRVNEFISKKY